MSQITHTPLDLSNAASVLFQQISEELISLGGTYSGETAPSDPVIGKQWFQPSTATVFVWTGSVWITGFVASAVGRMVVDGWYQDNVIASQVDVPLSRMAAGTLPFEWIALRAGSITGIAVKSGTARSAGTLTVEVISGGSPTGLTAVLDGTNTTFKATTQAAGINTYVAGANISIVVSTDAGWLPVTADIRAALEIQTAA